jgi:hypothetical protein
MELKINNATHSGRMAGSIVGTDSKIELGTVNLELDLKTAFALCNVLCENKIINHEYLGRDQHQPLINLGKAIAAYCGHSSADFEITK